MVWGLDWPPERPIASLPSLNPDAYPSPGVWLEPYTRYLFHARPGPSPSPARITCDIPSTALVALSSYLADKGDDAAMVLLYFLGLMGQ
jgi:hypothetical protein